MIAETNASVTVQEGAVKTNGQEEMAMGIENREIAKAHSMAHIETNG